MQIEKGKRRLLYKLSSRLLHFYLKNRRNRDQEILNSSIKAEVMSSIPWLDFEKKLNEDSEITVHLCALDAFWQIAENLRKYYGSKKNQNQQKEPYKLKQNIDDSDDNPVIRCNMMFLGAVFSDEIFSKFFFKKITKNKIHDWREHELVKEWSQNGGEVNFS